MTKQELKALLDKHGCKLAKTILFAIIDNNDFVREQIEEFIIELEKSEQKGALSGKVN